MGNAGQICGPGGSYNCYGDPVPICKCPHGRDGDRCQNDAKTTVSFHLNLNRNYTPSCSRLRIIHSFLEENLILDSFM